MAIRVPIMAIRVPIMAIRVGLLWSRQGRTEVLIRMPLLGSGFSIFSNPGQCASARALRR
jgi:hypothetical protein